MTIQETIQTALLTACSGTTSNVYYYLAAISKEFYNTDSVVIYELQNNSNTNTAEFRNAIRNYDLTIRISAPNQKRIQDLRVFITNKLLTLSGNVGYIGLTNEDQPVYNTDSQNFSSSITFNLLYLN